MSTVNKLSCIQWLHHFADREYQNYKPVTLVSVQKVAYDYFLLDLTMEK
jgi:hypothetical protein